MEVARLVFEVILALFCNLEALLSVLGLIAVIWFGIFAGRRALARGHVIEEVGAFMMKNKKSGGMNRF